MDEEIQAGKLALLPGKQYTPTKVYTVRGINNNNNDNVMYAQLVEAGGPVSLLHNQRWPLLDLYCSRAF